MAGCPLPHSPGDALLRGAAPVISTFLASTSSLEEVAKTHVNMILVKMGKVRNGDFAPDTIFRSTFVNTIECFFQHLSTRYICFVNICQHDTIFLSTIVNSFDPSIDPTELPAADTPKIR